MDEVELTQVDEPLGAWQVTDDGFKDQKSRCDDGKARRTYAATLDVPAPGTPPDPDNAEALLVGQLIDVAWDATTSSNDDVTGSVVAKRAKEDATGSKLTVDFSLVAGGWHYDLSTRTACLPTG